MPHRFVSRNAGQGQTAKPVGDFHTVGSLINTALFVHVGLATVIRAMAGEVISDPHQRAPQSAVGLSDDGPTIMIGLIALMT